MFVAASRAGSLESPRKLDPKRRWSSPVSRKNSVAVAVYCFSCSSEKAIVAPTVSTKIAITDQRRRLTIASDDRSVNPAFLCSS